MVLGPLLLVGSAGHSSWLYVIVLVGNCCLVVGWVCLAGVDVGVGVGVGVGVDVAVGVAVALWSVSFLRCCSSAWISSLSALSSDVAR